MRTGKVYVLIDVECDEHDAVAINYALHGVSQAFLAAAMQLQQTRMFPWRVTGASVLLPQPIPPAPQPN